ncbi:SLAP domain-containing protein [Lactobacillus sp.]|uniref:SLAP domain-containing protein n=1 Tax=Lactobacillus sp. TaxID=1591 RepID=UPI0025B8C777|nr:SLAP domain-containing protein [Lactobacillus sp.]
MIVYGTSYTKVSMTSQSDADGSNDNGGLWVMTKALANSTPAPETVTKTVMHKALVYDNSGSSKVRTIAAYTKVTVNKETISINGAEYYQIANKPDFIKASNVDGTKRTLKHNAYVYATSTKRANRVTLKKGTKITTYGSSYKFKNGKRYYRIEGATKTKKMYVKVANFK